MRMIQRVVFMIPYTSFYLEKILPKRCINFLFFPSSKRVAIPKRKNRLTGLFDSFSILRVASQSSLKSFYFLECSCTFCLAFLHASSTYASGGAFNGLDLIPAKGGPTNPTCPTIEPHTSHQSPARGDFVGLPSFHLPSPFALFGQIPDHVFCFR